MIGENGLTCGVYNGADLCVFDHIDSIEACRVRDPLREHEISLVRIRNPYPLRLVHRAHCIDGCG